MTTNPAPNETTADPIPADDAPHAYVAVLRTHSPYADRPEWAATSYVIPEHDHDELALARRRGYALLPIGSDGDAGTRAVIEPGPPPHVLEMRAGALFRRENGSLIRLIELAYTHRELARFRLSLATLAPELWVGELTAPNGVVEACLVTAANLAALGYTPAEVSDGE